MDQKRSQRCTVENEATDMYALPSWSVKVDPLSNQVSVHIDGHQNRASVWANTPNFADGTWHHVLIEVSGEHMQTADRLIHLC